MRMNINTYVFKVPAQLSDTRLDGVINTLFTLIQETDL